MRLFNYLSEGRSSNISEEEFRKKLPKHSNALKNPLFRAVRDFYDDYGFVVPSVFDRGSAYASYNFYTILIDNLTTWKGYPKRSKSVVCGSDMEMVSARSGRHYIVLPENGSKIGVCPAYDIWFSFQELEDKDIMNLDEFNDLLYDVWGKQIPKTYQEMIKQEVVNYHVLEQFFGGYERTDNFVTDYLNRILDPDKNGFELIKSGHEMGDGHEVWTEGDCLLYGTNTYDYKECISTLWEML